MLDEQSIDLADEIGKVAAEVGSTHTAVALAWVLAWRGVTSVIIGPRTDEADEQSMRASTWCSTADPAQRLSDASRWAR